MRAAPHGAGAIPQGPLPVSQKLASICFQMCILPMKIGILTQPLHTNYGCLLQAHALQCVLRQMGHDALTINWADRKNSLRTRLKKLVRHPYYKYILRVDGRLGPFKRQAFIRQHTDRFVRENIRTTAPVPVNDAGRALDEYNFDAYIVGSDQIWRPKYSPDIPTCFLDFLGDNSKVRRLAYAASFGTDKWEYEPALTQKCARLLQKFHAVSVREDSGVALCREHLGVASVHIPDPTMLLSRHDYVRLTEDDDASESPHKLMSYVLDRKPKIQTWLEKLSDDLGLSQNIIMPKRKLYPNIKAPAEAYVFPPVARWIRGFMDAEYVITDSFHGTVFAILFNKPFITIENASRGQARFHSLLKTFDLESRLVFPTDWEEASERIKQPVMWENINAILARNAEGGLAFLKQHLQP